MNYKNYQVCLITAGNKKTASKIANGLVRNNLAACVSIIPSIKSIYKWQGKIEKADEYLLIVKTQASLSKKIINFTKENHTYSNPEIIFFDIAGGSKKYLDWITQNTLKFKMRK
ncbi:MAG: divalent-cation tolerance protein CutA [Elusimicrobia bacterium]|nr:divalent-cation tolerance protein CutA [Elusimicrobiota bacterium]